MNALDLRKIVWDKVISIVHSTKGPNWNTHGRWDNLKKQEVHAKNDKWTLPKPVGDLLEIHIGKKEKNDKVHGEDLDRTLVGKLIGIWSTNKFTLMTPKWEKKYT